MELDDQLKQIAQAFGEPIDEERIREHKEFCEGLEENILLGEAGEIVEKLAASILLLLVRGAYDPMVKRSCRTLNALVLNRCMNEHPALAEEVRTGLAHILAPDLLPALTPVPGSRLRH